MATPATPQMTSPRPRSQGKHAFTVWAAIIGFCLAALTATYMLFVEAPPPRKIVIASGGKSGAYYQFAQKYAEALKKEGLTAEVRALYAATIDQTRIRLGPEHDGWRFCALTDLPPALAGTVRRALAAR